MGPMSRIALLLTLLAASLWARVTSPELPFYGPPPDWDGLSHRVGPFELVDQRNGRMTEEDLDGRLTVVGCLRTPIPAALENVDAELTGVQFLLLSQKTPADLAALGHVRGLDPARWRLATGFDATLRRVGGDCLLPRNPGSVALVDGDRRIRGLYGAGDPEEMRRLARDVKILQGE